MAVSSVKQFKKEAESEAQNLQENLKENLQTWTVQLATGKISKEDFEFLVMGAERIGSDEYFETKRNGFD